MNYFLSVSNNGSRLSLERVFEDPGYLILRIVNIANPSSYYSEVLLKHYPLDIVNPWTLVVSGTLVGNSFKTKNNQFQGELERTDTDSYRLRYVIGPPPNHPAGIQTAASVDVGQGYLFLTKTEVQMVLKMIEEVLTC